MRTCLYATTFVLMCCAATIDRRTRDQACRYESAFAWRCHQQNALSTKMPCHN